MAVWSEMERGCLVYSIGVCIKKFHSGTLHSPKGKRSGGGLCRRKNNKFPPTPPLFCQNLKELLPQFFCAKEKTTIFAPIKPTNCITKYLSMNK